MPTLQIEIPNHLYQQLREIARSQGQSLSAYVVTALEQTIDDEKTRAARSKAFASIRQRRRPLPANAPDSVTLIRKIRSENNYPIEQHRINC